MRKENPENTVAFATVPQAKSRDNDISELEFLTQTREVNTGIKALNEELVARWPNVKRAPKIHSWGARRTGFREEVAPKLKNSSLWRNRLELKAKHKIRIGKTLYNYFKAI